MTHFAVLVVTDGPEDVPSALAPYQENNMGTCPEQYLEFRDYEEEKAEEYETMGVDMVRGPSGDLRETTDDMFYRRAEPDEEQAFYAMTPRERGVEFAGARQLFPQGLLVRELPPGWQIEQVPLKEVWSSFEEFLKNAYELTRDEKTGRYGLWFNPNDKWDYWLIGGRYEGMLRRKSWFNRACNQCQVKDLDLKGMLQTQRYNHAVLWDEMEAHYQQQPYKNLSYERARELWLEKLTQAKRLFAEKDGKVPLYEIIAEDEVATRLQRSLSDGPFDPIPDDATSQKQFVEQATGLPVNTIVKDGEWLSQRETGWFGSYQELVNEAHWRKFS